MADHAAVPAGIPGPGLVGSFLAAVAFRDGRTYQLVETRANSQLAFGAFLTQPRPGGEDANGLIVLALTGGQIAAMTRFPASVLPRFSRGRLRQEDSGRAAYNRRPGRPATRWALPGAYGLCGCLAWGRWRVPVRCLG